MKAILFPAMSLLAAATLVNTAYATQYKVDFDQDPTRAHGYFSCAVEGNLPHPDKIPAQIVSHHAYVRGKHCAGGGILKDLSVTDLRKYAFEYEIHGTSPNAVVEANDGVTNIICELSGHGKPVYEGGYCAYPQND